jgi:hypothetical protein
MNAPIKLDALFYPFHLCHQETLGRMLQRFPTVHFRDFMALRLTPLGGLTAFPERMGDRNPEFLLNGRIVEGHNVSGPLPACVAASVDRDLDDPVWRVLFHSAIENDLRLRLGLFPADAVPSGWPKESTASGPFSIDVLRSLLSGARERVYPIQIEYGLALVKTSAALAHTTELARSHALQAATDSAAHFALYERSCRRDGIVILNHLLLRNGY